MKRVCSNCKKEYNVEYGVCPFCGERNDIYDEDKPTLDERRDLESNEQQEFVEDEKMKKEEEYDEEKLKALGCPKTYMTESVLATIFCCFPVGVFGIINANKVESFYRKEQYKKAFEASQKARKLFIASLVIGIVVGLSMIIWGIVYVSNQATYINLSENYISTGPKAFSKTIDVESDGKWDVDFSSPWIGTSKNKNGKAFGLYVDKNTTGEHRAGWVTISSGSLQARIAVEQNGTATYLTADSTQLRYGRGSVYDHQINVQTDGIEWKITERPGFGLITKEDYCFTVRLSDNSGYNDWKKSGTIVLEADDETLTIPISQAGECQRCNGNGEITCPTCEGNGKYRSSGTRWDPYTNWGFGGWENYSYMSDCSRCEQTGEIQCPDCGGTGIDD